MELAENLMSWWIEDGDSKSDNLKNPDFLYNLMFQDNGRSQFYLIEGLLFIVSNIAGGSAIVLELGLAEGKYDPKAAKNELINIVREHELHRLSFGCPSAVTAFYPKLKELGFKREGRLKYACNYNGKLADVDLFGFYSIKPEKHRRRRGRRNGKQKGSFKNPNGSGTSGRRKNFSHGEAARSGGSEG